MPPPVFSERFLRCVSPGVWQTYTVPSGHRVVVRNIVAANGLGSSSGYVQVDAADVRLLLRYPAANATESYDLRQVIYAGERLSGITSVSGLTLFVSGYLFANAAGAADDPPPVEHHRDKLPTPLPS